jgi:hypothetical protein
VAETIGTDRLALLGHSVLGADSKTIESIADVIVKVARNAEALKAEA